MEGKRISTNPFLYEDGSLVEAEVLRADIDEKSSGSSGSVTPRNGHKSQGDDSQCSESTPQCEIVPRHAWSGARAGVVSMDLDDDKIQTMTGSYSEIFERPIYQEKIAEETDAEMQEADDEDVGKEDEELATPVCAEVDPVQAFLTKTRLNDFMARDDSLADANDYPHHLHSIKGRPSTLNFGSCSPEEAENALQSEGQVMREGHLISFVADDLENKIKLSSPVSRGSRSSTPSLLRAALAPQVPPIDPTVINDIEVHARRIATSVDTLIENLTGTLHSISALTVDCVETYRDAVCKTCDAVDANIKSMYQLMAKCEELSKSMRPVYQLQDQIKEVKRLLDLFENVMHLSGS